MAPVGIMGVKNASEHAMKKNRYPGKKKEVGKYHSYSDPDTCNLLLQWGTTNIGVKRRKPIADFCAVNPEENI